MNLFIYAFSITVLNLQNFISIDIYYAILIKIFCFIAVGGFL